jgi:hypothetical protein
MLYFGTGQHLPLHVGLTSNRHYYMTVYHPTARPPIIRSTTPTNHHHRGGGVGCGDNMVARMFSKRCCQCKKGFKPAHLQSSTGNYCFKCRSRRSAQLSYRKQELERLPELSCSSTFTTTSDARLVIRMDVVALQLRKYLNTNQERFIKLSCTGGLGISGTLRVSSVDAAVDLILNKGVCI